MSLVSRKTKENVSTVKTPAASSSAGCANGKARAGGAACGTAQARRAPRGALKAVTVALLCAIVLAPITGSSQEVATLDQLLQQTRDIRAREQERNRERERRFIESRDRQAALLEEARHELTRERQRSSDLNERFDDNERRLATLEEQLEARAGTVGEMFGVVRQAAGDTASIVHNSMVSAEHPDREQFASNLAQSRALPTIEELERLWFEMQREMTETGRVARFAARVIGPDGSESARDVIRVGPFTAMAGGQFLTYVPESRRFAELTRQPPGRFRSASSGLASTNGAYASAVLDPTRGSLLSVLVQQPSLRETVEYGGLVGYLIMALAAVGLLVGVARLFRLSEMSAAVARQKKRIDRPYDNNPLGRVLMVYHHNPDADKDTLQLRLDEAVLKEVPRLETGLGALKILAAIGPLMGLLGTVTGMIITFQQITLFGTGDPKLMASGISQALVTTVLGLVMAIPLLLLHSFLSSRSKDLIHVLEEETAGIIAEQAEHGRPAVTAAGA